MMVTVSERLRIGEGASDCNPQTIMDTWETRSRGPPSGPTVGPDKVVRPPAPSSDNSWYPAPWQSDNPWQNNGWSDEHWANHTREARAETFRHFQLCSGLLRKCRLQCPLRQWHRLQRLLQRPPPKGRPPLLQPGARPSDDLPEDPVQAFWAEQDAEERENLDHYWRGTTTKRNF